MTGEVGGAVKSFIKFRGVTDEVLTSDGSEAFSSQVEELLRLELDLGC